ncbi:50S ribosomal protein L19 [Patescibacteria group bacterium]|nr:50S ribosomal protein L19 [Patescibacteria group bacterium]
MDLLQEFEKKQATRKIPYIKPGDTIKVHQKIKEGDKQRIQVFEGVVIKIHCGFGINGNVTVRKIASGVGVEKTFPFHLPSITKLEVVRRGKVRRARLYYLRELQEKAARLKEKKLTQKVKDGLRFESDEEKKEQEAKKAKKKEEKGTEKDTKLKEEKKPENKKGGKSKENKPSPAKTPTEKKEKPEKDEKAEKKEPDKKEKK